MLHARYEVLHAFSWLCEPLLSEIEADLFVSQRSARMKQNVELVLDRHVRKKILMSVKRKLFDIYPATLTVRDTVPSIQITDTRFPGQGYRLGSIEEMKAKCRIASQICRSESQDICRSESQDICRSESQDICMNAQYALYVGRP